MKKNKIKAKKNKLLKPWADLRKNCKRPWADLRKIEFIDFFYL